METYQEMQARHQKAISSFPVKFAFSKEQFAQAMQELGLEPNQTSEVVSIGGGGFVRKRDKEDLLNLFDKHRLEHEAALASDTDGKGYAYQMFLYELGNHEYVITYDLEDTLNACGVTADEINSSPALLKALDNALQDYLKVADA